MMNLNKFLLPLILCLLSGFYSFGQTAGAFITSWDVEANDQIVIPLQSGTYDFDFIWSLTIDPTVQISGTHINADGDFITDFVEEGIYELEIVGDFPHLRGYPVDKLLDVIQWGDIEWGSMQSAFQDFLGTGFSAIDSPNLSLVTNMQNVFANAADFNSDISAWDVSNVTSMSNMFRGASQFNGNISSWIVSNVSSMSNMFRGASAFNQPIGIWDVSGVGSMQEMFRGAISFNQPLGSWTLNASNIVFMFTSASSFNQDLSAWDVGGITQMDALFANAASFNGDITTWDVSSVIDMQSMFIGASSFNQDISSWDVSKVINMRQMFRQASSFNQPIGNWEVNNVTDFIELFFNASSFNQPLGGWQFDSIEFFSNVFTGATGFNCENWSSTILGWNFSNPELQNIAIGGPNSDYDIIASIARDELIARGWTINGTDVGGDCGAIFEFPCNDSLVLHSDTLFGNLIIGAKDIIQLEGVTFVTPSNILIKAPEVLLDTLTSIEVEVEVEILSEDGCQ